jgi:hypothetical protein
MSKLTVLFLSIFLILSLENTSANVVLNNLSDISSNISNLGSWQEKLDLRRGGRGFGGSRRSFGGSRSKSRSTPKRSASRAKSTPKASPKRPSFGGNRMSSKQAKQKYGVPTKTQPVTKASATGQQTNYVMHHYGGYSSGLMTGYMMGHTSMLWMMPFHPAFYYSRPNYVENADGTVSVYPPTFSFSKLLMTLIVIGIVVYFIRNYFRKKNQSNSDNQGSFV